MSDREDQEQAHDPNLQRVLAGHYRIDELVGCGGMGRVYRGTQLSVNRPVAIKLIAADVARNQEFVERFRREAEATGRLGHPNTVRLYDFDVTGDGELYMVMELLKGWDLSARLEAEGALPVIEALSIARQVLQGLAEAHALGIVHRDLKPANVFLAELRSGEMMVKVMDFGIARLEQAEGRERLTSTGAPIGTPAYMSPEQAQGEPVDARSDLYSLGIMLFEMLTGQPPFEADTPVSLLVAHVTKAAPRLRDVRPTFPSNGALQQLLDQLLAKRPEDRLSSAMVGLQQIDAILHANRVTTMAGPAPRGDASAAVESSNSAVDTFGAFAKPAGHGEVHGRRGRRGGRAIAGLALLAGAGALWYAGRGTPSAGPAPPSPRPDAVSDTDRLAPLAPADTAPPSGPGGQGPHESAVPVQEATSDESGPSSVASERLDPGPQLNEDRLSPPAAQEPATDVQELVQEPADVLRSTSTESLRSSSALAAHAAGESPAGPPLRAHSATGARSAARSEPKPAGPASSGSASSGSASRALHAAPLQVPRSNHEEPPPVPAPEHTLAPSTPAAPTPHPQVVPPSRNPVAARIDAMLASDDEATRRAAMLRRGPPYDNLADVHRAYQSGQINRRTFDDTVWVLGRRRDALLRAARLARAQGEITEAELQARQAAIEADYRGRPTPY